MISTCQHNFYIPVMGTSFTIDTPLLIAKHGISSVISLVDDVLIEQVRKYWSTQYNEPFEPITNAVPDHRAKRITAYLNLLNKLVNDQITKLKNCQTETEEFKFYFELLPTNNNSHKIYQQLLNTNNPTQRAELLAELRNSITPGSIDVNIMTKLDVASYDQQGGLLPYQFSDAASALRGYATSDLSSTMVFSAGFNPHLYNYLAEFSDFFPNQHHALKKKLCLKVSDYRSATIQGKYLAKRGIWVSEYRVESAINCGGHAFLNDGHLLGPILEEFKDKKKVLVEELHSIYAAALNKLKGITLKEPLAIKITTQGGVGTHEEHDFLLNYYKLDAIGWGSPFLLVPEATNVDHKTLEQLLAATEQGVYLSKSSPIGVPFWNLKNSTSEQARLKRISDGTPGSPCIKGFTRLNTEFTDKPICQASRQYQSLKLKELESRTDLDLEQKSRISEEIMLKSCICNDLGGSVLLKREITINTPPAICPGPNIVNFKKILTLKELVDHIYGKRQLLINPNRPHVFIRELQLQVSILAKELKDASANLPARSKKKLAEVKNNLQSGIEYYRKIIGSSIEEKEKLFLKHLADLARELNQLVITSS